MSGARIARLVSRSWPRYLWHSLRHAERAHVRWARMSREASGIWREWYSVSARSCGDDINHYRRLLGLPSVCALQLVVAS